LRFNIGRRIRASIAGAKTASWPSVLGYGVAELQAHLEGLFKPGMSWENYGIHWHIDHRRPVASFGAMAIGDEMFSECWALSNLQPLEAVENLRKGCRL